MLKIFINNTDRSLELENYLSDIVHVNFPQGQTIDVGYYKPISDLYIELKTSHSDGVMTFQYWNGTWQSLVVNDRTKGFFRSGFIRWSKPLDEKKVTLHGQELFWYKISLDDNINNLQLAGINLVFADDADLKESYPDIVEFLPEGNTSFIGYHQEARNYILTYLRNKGKTIYQQNKYKLLDQFDLHNFDEVRQAGKYLALANIFANESDSVDDKWKQKSDGFYKKYAEAINLYSLSIDENDNGKVDNNESSAIQYIRVQRL